MVAAVDTDVTEVVGVTDSADVTTPATPRLRLAVKVAVVATALVGLATAGVAGWYGPRLVNALDARSYAGGSAASVATDLGCTDYKQSTTHDESVYKYHDQGTCVFDSTRVTITTFDNQADGDAFITLMNGLIPVVHPTWVGAATAAGEGWNVADATNLSPKVAEAAIVKLGAGEVHVIPAAKRS